MLSRARTRRRSGRRGDRAGRLRAPLRRPRPGARPGRRLRSARLGLGGRRQRLKRPAPGPASTETVQADLGREPGDAAVRAAVAIAGGVLLNWLSDLTFWRDEWAFILDRRGSGLDTYLDPYVEQLLAIPIASYKLLIALFGIESPIPFQVASTLVFLASVVAPVRLRPPAGGGVAGARRRAPDPLPRPVLGRPAVPVSDRFFGSVACGLGALLALDREDRRGDVIACALLAIGLFCSHVGIPFVVAATVDIGLTRERFRRAFVVVMPTALWLIWYLGWGRETRRTSSPSTTSRPCPGTSPTASRPASRPCSGSRCPATRRRSRRSTGAGRCS